MYGCTVHNNTSNTIFNKVVNINDNIILFNVPLFFLKSEHFIGSGHVFVNLFFYIVSSVLEDILNDILFSQC